MAVRDLAPLSLRLTLKQAQVIATNEWLIRSGWCGRNGAPHFFGIGSPQSGTTWLHTQLASHPDISLPDDKEAHYFTLRIRHKDLRWYFSILNREGSVIGEITPSYMRATDSRIRLMERVSPGFLALLLVRNPILREWSAERLRWRRKGRDVSTLTDDEMIESIRTREPDGFGDYPETIRKFREVIGTQRLLVIDFLEISERPVEVLDKVSQFLGVSNVQHIAGAVNSNPKRPIPAAAQQLLAERFQPVFTLMRPEFPHLVERWERGEE